MVRFKSATPVKTFTTPIEVHVTNNTDDDPDNNLSDSVQVRLDCPTGRVWFANNVNASDKQDAKTITLPVSGAYIALYITGEQKSLSKNDAAIRATKPATTPAVIYGSQPATVFWFDAPSMNPVVNTSPYVIVNRLFQPEDENSTVKLFGKITLRPANLDANAPQLRALRVGFEQTVVSSRRSSIYDYQSISQWSPSLPSGSTINVPVSRSVTTVFDDVVDSGSESWVPLYDNREFIRGTTFIPCSPLNVTGVTSINTEDKPSTPSLSYREVKDSGGSVIAIAFYLARSRGLMINDVFRDWVVVHDTTATDLLKSEWFAEGSWSIIVTAGRNQSATFGFKDKLDFTDQPKEIGPTIGTRAAGIPIVDSSETRPSEPKP